MMASLKLIMYLAQSVFVLIAISQPFYSAVSLSVTRGAVNWDLVVSSSEVPATSPSLPPGCRCRSSTASPATCTTFECECICDLNPNDCDAGCCCDTKCPTFLTELARTNGICKAEGPKASTVVYCTRDISDLVAVNAKYRMSFDWSKDLVGDLLCVVVDNSELVAKQLSDPGQQSPLKFTQFADVVTYMESAPEVNTLTTATGYSFGDPILAFLPISGSSSYRPAFGGYLPSPSAVPSSGKCSDLTRVRFGSSIPQSNCVRYVSNLAGECARTFSASPFISLLLGNSPSSPDPYVGLSAVNAYKYSSASQTTTAVNSANAYKSASWDSATSTCINAVKSVDYTISYNEQGQIENATAAFVVADVTAKADGSGIIFQSFTSLFKSPNATSGSLLRSGNPGYLVGLPLRTGKVVQSPDGTKTAIAESLAGMPVLAPGWCGDQGELKANFGFEISSACMYEVSQSGLASLCTGTIPSPLAFEETHVAIFGNSDPTHLWEWQQISVDSTPSSSTYNAGTGTCSNMVTGLHIQFIVADVGTYGNPQKKIVGAKGVYTTEDVRIVPEVYGAEKLILTMTVSYHTIGDIAATTNPATPLDGAFLSDLLYPFMTSSAGEGRCGITLLAVMAFLANTLTFHMVAR